MSHDTRNTTNSGKPVHVLNARDSAAPTDDDGFDVGDPTNKAVRVNLVAGGNVSLNSSVMIWDGTDTLQVNTDGSINVVTVAANLESRMLNSQPQTGWTLWFDTADTSFLYILEALSTKTAGQTGFQGIRITLDSSGNPVGKVQSNTGATLTFSNRTTDTGWS